MADVAERFEVVDRASPPVKWTGPERFAVVDNRKGGEVVALADTRECAERTADRLNENPPDADPRERGVFLP